MSAIRHKALSVSCPICKALARVDCDAPNKPGGWHVQRATRGIRAAAKDEYGQHGRAVAALSRIRAARRTGRRVDERDVTAALACVCPDECGGIDNLLRIADELVALGAIDIKQQGR